MQGSQTMFRFRLSNAILARFHRFQATEALPWSKPVFQTHLSRVLYQVSKRIGRLWWYR